MLDLLVRQDVDLPSLGSLLRFDPSLFGFDEVFTIDVLQRRLHFERVTISSLRGEEPTLATFLGVRHLWPVVADVVTLLVVESLTVFELLVGTV